MIYLKYNYINKSYNFNIKLNYDFKTWKNQTNITLGMVCVIVTTPHNQGKVLSLIVLWLKVVEESKHV